MHIGKKKIIVLILICAIAFAIYWMATGYQRYRDHAINELENSISQFRNDYNADSNKTFYFYISSPKKEEYKERLKEDSKFKESVAAETKKMCDNNETKLLIQFLYRIILSQNSGL